MATAILHLCSALEHDHKLVPRPLPAIIDCGNDDPDLVGASWGMGDLVGAGLSYRGEPALIYVRSGRVTMARPFSF
jgi:hypothetical protein